MNDNINSFKGFCDILKATECHICEDCGTGVIIFSHDEYTLDTAMKFRVNKFKEDIATALTDATALLANCEDAAEFAFYASVRMRLIALSLLQLKKE